MDFHYNHELLLEASDRDRFHRQYPNLGFAFDHPALRTAFEKIDTDANQAKASSRRWGIGAVLLAAIALIIAALEPLLHKHLGHGAPGWLPKAIAGVAGGAGVFAVIVGYFQVLFGNKKHHWLHQRLITERLRQWHFQWIIGELPAILRAAQSEPEKATLLQRRADQFQDFERHFIDQVAAEFPRYVESGDGPHAREAEDLVWMSSGWNNSGGAFSEDCPQELVDELFSAFEATRIRGQMQYVNYKLQSKRSRFLSHPGKQIRLLSNVALVCILDIFGLHLLVLLGVLSGHDWMKGEIVHALTVVAAIIALAGRALEEGLQPHRELEQMQGYALRLRQAEKLFRTSDENQTKLQALREIESASVAEMIQFLTTHEESRFAM